MEKCRLVKPDVTMATEIRAYRDAMLRADSSMDGTGPLMRMEQVEEWLAFNRMLENPATVPEKYAPLHSAEQFVYVRSSDSRIVGMLQIRRYGEAELTASTGNIGFSVRPDERRKGCAKRMLAAGLAVCRAQDFRRVLITCLTDNEASRRTMLANGGIYEGTVHFEPHNVDLQRYWFEL